MADNFRVPNRSSKSAQIRARMGHPIIDSDGHTLENRTVLAEYIRSVAGPKTAERFAASGGGYGSLLPGRTLAEARDMGITRGPWWAVPAANTLDRATAMLPKLLYERLDELGLDYSVLYTTVGFALIGIRRRGAPARLVSRIESNAC